MLLWWGRRCNTAQASMLACQVPERSGIRGSRPSPESFCSARRTVSRMRRKMVWQNHVVILMEHRCNIRSGAIRAGRRAAFQEPGSNRDHETQHQVRSGELQLVTPIVRPGPCFPARVTSVRGNYERRLIDVARKEHRAGEDTGSRSQQSRRDCGKARNAVICSRIRSRPEAEPDGPTLSGGGRRLRPLRHLALVIPIGNVTAALPAREDFCRRHRPRSVLRTPAISLRPDRGLQRAHYIGTPARSL